MLRINEHAQLEDEIYQLTTGRTLSIPDFENLLRRLVSQHAVAATVYTYDQMRLQYPNVSWTATPDVYEVMVPLEVADAKDSKIGHAILHQIGYLPQAVKPRRRLSKIVKGYLHSAETQPVIERWGQRAIEIVSNNETALAMGRFELARYLALQMGDLSAKNARYIVSYLKRMKVWNDDNKPERKFEGMEGSVLEMQLDKRPLKRDRKDGIVPVKKSIKLPRLRNFDVNAPEWSFIKKTDVDQLYKCEYCQICCKLTDMPGHFAGKKHIRNYALRNSPNDASSFSPVSPSSLSFESSPSLGIYRPSNSIAFQTPTAPFSSSSSSSSSTSGSSMVSSSLAPSSSSSSTVFPSSSQYQTYPPLMPYQHQQFPQPQTLGALQPRPLTHPQVQLYPFSDGEPRIPFVVADFSDQFRQLKELG